MLRTNSQIVEKLVEQGLLSLRPDEHELIEAESIQRFVDKYLLVNRKATFSQSRNIAQKISSCCGTQPVFSMYMNSTKTEFVVFRKQELASCCMQQVPKRFAHFSTPRVDLSKKAHSLFANISGDTNEHRYFWEWSSQSKKLMMDNEKYYVLSIACLLWKSSRSEQTSAPYQHAHPRIFHILKISKIKWLSQKSILHQRHLRFILRADYNF